MSANVLEVRHLARSFDSKVVLRDISFDLHEGEILALMGASGGGKSLILKTIIGLEFPDSGHILFGGQNICTLDDEAFRKIRQRIAFVFQNGALFNSLTVEENLSYPLRLHTTLSDAEIHAKVNERLGLLDVAGVNGLYPDALSGGMEKRVGLARATMLDPPVMLFDEPTAGLDPMHVALFARAMKRLKKERGVTGIFVTHDVPCAFAVSDRVALIRDGIIHASGTVEEISRSTDPWVRSYLFPEYEERFHEIRPAS